MNRIIDNEQPIRSISAATRGGATVGFPQNDPVTKIEPYLEEGQMTFVTWLRVWKGDKLAARFNTAHIREINY